MLFILLPFRGSMRLLSVVLVALASHPLALAAADASTTSATSPFSARDDTCRLADGPLVDCWLDAEVDVVVACPAGGNCTFEPDGRARTADAAPLRTISTTLRVVSGQVEMRVVTRCTLVAVGEAECPVFGETNAAVAPGACVPVWVEATYQNGDAERATARASRWLCRAADGTPAWS